MDHQRTHKLEEYHHETRAYQQHNKTHIVQQLADFQRKLELHDELIKKKKKDLPIMKNINICWF